MTAPDGPALIRLRWAPDSEMSQTLRARINELPPIIGMMWEAVSVSALPDEVLVLVVAKATPDDRP